MLRSVTLILATASLVGAILVASAGTRPHQLYIQPGREQPADLQGLVRRP